MRPDGTTVDSVGQVLNPLTLEVVDRGYGRPPTDELLRPAPVLAPCGALAVYRRQALASATDEHGPWAERYFCFWEDLELGWRLVNGGWRIRTCPEAVATHRRGAGADAGRGPLRWRRPPELEACIVSNRWMTLENSLFFIVVFNPGISIRTGQFGIHRVHPVHNSAKRPSSNLPDVPTVHEAPMPPE